MISDTVYILAPGPTLGLVPFERLKNKSTICINAAIELFQPNYWVVTSQEILKHYKKVKVPSFVYAGGENALVRAVQLVNGHAKKIILFGSDFVNLRNLPPVYDDIGNDFYATGITFPVPEDPDKAIQKALEDFRSFLRENKDIISKLYSPSKFLCSVIPVNRLCLRKCF